MAERDGERTQLFWVRSPGAGREGLVGGQAIVVGQDRVRHDLCSATGASREVVIEDLVVREKVPEGGVVEGTELGLLET